MDLDLAHHVKAFIEGDQDSFRWFYEKYHRLIYTYILRFVKLETIAEEAATDVFVKLWEKRESLDSDGPLTPLLYKIAKDTAYNYLKKIASDQKLKAKFMQIYAGVDQKNGEQIFLEKERLQALQKVIDTLPPQRLKIFKLRYYEGLDNPAIAERLEISVNTVKVHLAKARTYLKEHMPIQDDTFMAILFCVLLPALEL